MQSYKENLNKLNRYQALNTIKNIIPQILKTFKYVAFEGCCALPENQHLIIALMESCLALHQRHVGIMYLDVAELNFPYFKRSNRMGFMRKIQEPPAVQFLCNFIQIQDTEKEKFYELPKYISSFDLT